MASSNTYKKIFIDSRWRTSGDNNDFTIELTDDVDTTRTTSVYLASCSFANTFETILPGVNDNFYVVAQDVANAPKGCRASSPSLWSLKWCPRHRSAA